MNYKELLARVEADFGVKLTVEKEKAGYLMLREGGTLGNWDCGHSCPAKRPYVELPSGWAYVLDSQTDTWARLRDGCCGWRQGDEGEFGKTLADATISPF